MIRYKNIIAGQATKDAWHWYWAVTQYENRGGGSQPIESCISGRDVMFRIYHLDMINETR